MDDTWREKVEGFMKMHPEPKRPSEIVKMMLEKKGQEN